MALDAPDTISSPVESSDESVAGKAHTIILHLKEGSRLTVQTKHGVITIHPKLTEHTEIIQAGQYVVGTADNKSKSMGEDELTATLLTSLEDNSVISKEISAADLLAQVAEVPGPVAVATASDTTSAAVTAATKPAPEILQEGIPKGFEVLKMGLSTDEFYAEHVNTDCAGKVVFLVGKKSSLVRVVPDPERTNACAKRPIPGIVYINDQAILKCRIFAGDREFIENQGQDGTGRHALGEVVADSQNLTVIRPIITGSVPTIPRSITPVRVSPSTT